MQTHLIEASNGFNWGKFLVGRFTEEWAARSDIDQGPLLASRGWRPDNLLVLDLQTGEGAVFRPGGSARADLEKHRVWVCPLFEPFLEWLYRQPLDDITKLPRSVGLPGVPSALYGHRRPGPDGGASA